MRTRNRHRGFSQLELLVAVTIVGVLSLLSFSIYETVLQRLVRIQCSDRLRSIGNAAQLYAADHDHQLPRSWHSAAAHNEPGWAMSLLPYFAVSMEQAGDHWQDVFNRHYRSPSDAQTNPHIYSYALNVYFELNPASDDYYGSPQVWRTLHAIPHLQRTVLFAQCKPVLYGDHLMCHLWSSARAARNALNHDAYDGRAHYLFADGHVELLELSSVYDPDREVNLFHPLLAR